MAQKLKTWSAAAWTFPSLPRLWSSCFRLPRAACHFGQHFGMNDKGWGVNLTNWGGGRRGGGGRGGKAWQCLKGKERCTLLTPLLVPAPVRRAEIAQDRECCLKAADTFGLPRNWRVCFNSWLHSGAQHTLHLRCVGTSGEGENVVPRILKVCDEEGTALHSLIFFLFLYFTNP